MESSQDKNLPATGRRLQQARDEGQVARSKELTNLLVLGVGFALLVSLFALGTSTMLDGLRNLLRFDHASLLRGDLMANRLEEGLMGGLMVVLPLALVLPALSIGGALAVGGWTFSFKPVMPEFTKLDPLAGFGRLFAKQQWFEVAKLMTLTTVIGFVGWTYLGAHLVDFASLMLGTVDAGVIRMGEWLVNGIAMLMGVVLLTALIDVPMQKFLFLRRMRMYHEEVKQEHKETEGNPQLKGRLRALQREIANRNSIAQVPTADMVVMNPTHYAVAIRYDDATMAAPRVVAKGADLLAFKIKEVAQDSQVPVLQSPMLARALYAHAELNEEIPAALYTAVAQVLAYVYQVKAALQGKGRMPVAQPDPQVPPELDPHHARAQGKTRSEVSD